MENNNLDLETVLFHSLGEFGQENRDKNCLKKLESILKSGLILSRQSQLEKNTNDSQLSEFLQKYLDIKYSYNWNGMNHISICQKNSQKFDDRDSEAFSEYVTGNGGIGIVLSKDVLNIIDNERTQLMDGEFQVENEIPLSYMVGIFCGGKSFHELNCEIESARQQYDMSAQEIKDLLPHSLTSGQIEIYNSIQSLLDNYGYNVPIYSSRDGFPVVGIDTVLTEIDMQQC